MIQISTENKGLMDKLTALRGGKGVKYAVGMAMTWVAQDASRVFQILLNAKIDKPTPQTQKASRMAPANKDKTEMDVYVQDENSKGTPPSKYLRALLMGGYRANKRSENLLRAKNILPPGWQIQPGDDAPLDQYGNIRGGGARMVQILSGLQAFREVGHTMNRTNASMARSQASSRPMAEFFVLYSLKTKTPIGVFTRKGRKGKLLAQILKFTPKRARYTQILDFRAVVAKVFRQNFEIHLQEGLRRMIAKVKTW